MVDRLVSVEVMNLPEFQACAKACHNWFTEIMNALDSPRTNGYTEGRNNKAKVLKCVCFGKPNFQSFRSRILFSYT